VVVPQTPAALFCQTECSEPGITAAAAAAADQMLLRSAGTDDDNCVTSASGMKSTARAVPPMTDESRDRCAMAASSGDV